MLTSHHHRIRINRLDGKRFWFKALFVRLGIERISDIDKFAHQTILLTQICFEDGQPFRDHAWIKLNQELGQFLELPNHTKIVFSACIRQYPDHKRKYSLGQIADVQIGEQRDPSQIVLTKTRRKRQQRKAATELMLNDPQAWLRLLRKPPKPPVVQKRIPIPVEPVVCDVHVTGDLHDILYKAKLEYPTYEYRAGSPPDSRVQNWFRCIAQWRDFQACGEGPSKKVARNSAAKKLTPQIDTVLLE
jgi:hypothetical protein